MDWLDLAVCTKVSEAVGENPWISNDGDREWAALHCAFCPVFSECARYVQTIPRPRVGVYAGVLYDEGRTLMERSKVCRSCWGEKPRYEFDRHPKTRDGLDPRCKRCKREDARLRREGVA